MATAPSTERLPAAATPAVEIVRRLQAAQHLAYLVGGSLRDLALDLPTGDWDVATNATPAELAELFPGARHVGAAFGVILVPTAGDPIEVATFREDGVYDDGRHPRDVRLASSPQVDARRRDFTANALYLDPVADELLDPVGAMADLDARLLRTVGNPSARFAEDGLRLLRAARFAARCVLEIESDTLRGLAANAALIDRIAPERIGEELVRILRGPQPSRAFEILREAGVLERILPEVTALHGIPQPPQHHPEGCVWTHTMLLLDTAKEPSRELALACLLHDVGKPATRQDRDGVPHFPSHARVGAHMTDAILSRLRFSTRTIQRVATLVDRHSQFYDVEQMRTATLKRFLALPKFDELLELHRLDRLAAGGDLSHWEFCRERRREWSAEQLTPRALLGGADLMRLGYPRGPLLGHILEGLATAQLEGEVTDRATALAWLNERFPRGE